VPRIHREGDPLLFNLAINPLIAYLLKSKDCVYLAQLLAANSMNIPPISVPIYAFWYDSSKDSPVGWYRPV